MESASEFEVYKEKVASLSHDEVLDLFNRTIPDAKCSMCGGSELTLPRDPMTGGLATVSLPSPFNQKMGVWHFIATCDDCAHTVLFDVKLVLSKLEQARKGAAT